MRGGACARGGRGGGGCRGEQEEGSCKRGRTRRLETPTTTTWRGREAEELLHLARSVSASMSLM